MERPKTTLFLLRETLSWALGHKLAIAALAAVVGCALAVSRPRVRPEAPSHPSAGEPVVVAEPERLLARSAEPPKPAAPTSPGTPQAEPADKVEVVIPATPLHEEQAAQYLAEALHKVVGSRASENAVAVLWAHWAHETGRGRRMMGHNFAGIKGEGTQGGARVWTREAAGSKKKLVRRTFRVYESPEQGALDYVNLLLTRYRGSLSAAREGRTADFVHVLLKRGYYTDEKGVYERAITRLAVECRKRELARRALDSERNAGKCFCHATPVKQDRPKLREKNPEWLGL